MNSSLSDGSDPSSLATTLFERTSRRVLATANRARQSSGSGRNSRWAAAAFRVAKSRPQVWNNSRAFASVIHPSTATRPGVWPVLLRRGDVEVLPAPAPLDDLKGIPGRAGLMDQDHGLRALFRGDLVLVRPSAVVRHRPALEDGRVELGWVFRVGHRRVVHQHDQGLAVHVEALVVVPAVLRRDHAIADEDHVRVLDLHLLRHPPGHGHEVVGERQSVTSRPRAWKAPVTCLAWKPTSGTAWR